ncbi:serine/threonine-protein kinase [Planctomicrobium piriforme]|uniref:Serine/threonine protein kinase n=1 Tax=Planctomicrobium piriforme TaxID=1576369 RepID=A0A1I3AS15_9PLAN|nr:serine/threonine-protein kinase [Planctomicrobium piriforme]SFH52529.1 serine/threonine protein kinase [Planctomicrobium piriforme]
MADAETIDDYELVNCIATGNATQIWEVKKAGNTQPLAMKILLPEAFKDPEQKAALKHEANVARSLDHPNIIRVLETKFSKKHGYFVMEYFRGGNLKGLVRNDHAQVQAKAKRIVECMAQALGHMHDKKWIHKDVKPDNVMVTKGGEVRLIDFSLAGRAGNVVAHVLTKKSKIVIQGTRTYLAPELIRREVTTHSVDIYSLGVLFFELLVGHPPFRHGNPNELLIMHVRDTPPPPSMLDSNITPEADKIVLKMLSKYPKLRQANMQEVYSELRNLTLFKEDPIEHTRAKAEKFAKSDAQAQNDRLDSRRDAERAASGEVRPAPRPKVKPKLILPDDKPAPKAPAAVAPPQPAPQPVPQPMMPQPQYGYPGMPMPGYPMQPGMPMAGYPMQPGMPQMPFPGGYPGMMPGMQMPGMPGPGMPMPGTPGQTYQPGAGPVPGGPVAAPQPTAPRPAAPLPVAPKPTVVPPKAAPAKEEAPLASIDDFDIE